MKRAEESPQVASFTLRRLLLLLEWITPLRYATVGMTDVSDLVVTIQNVQRVALRPGGGRLPPLHCVVPFGRTGYNCNVAGGW